MPPKLLDFQPAFEAVLPPDWVLIGRHRVGEGQDAVGGGCFVLAHAEIGVALVDLLPMRTPQAEAQLRRLLNAVDFSIQCRGYLPIVQCELRPEELGTLRTRIEDAFAYDSVLTIADRGRWVGVLRRTLRAGVTWEALEGPLPDPIGRTSGRRLLPPWIAAPAARFARAGLVGCGLFGIFGLGFATALLLPPEPTASLPQPAAVGIGVVAAATLPPEPAPVQVPAAMEEAPLPVTASIEPPPPEARPSDPQPAVETHAMALPAAARRSTRLPMPIDRRCSEAVFRFQQGASLTAQEMAHVRQGCASLR